MNLKHIISLTLSLALALGLLAGCGSQQNNQSAEKTPEELTQAYADAINNCGSEAVEYNPVLSVYDPEANPDIDLMLQMLGLTADDMSAFGISLSLMNVKAYGIAAIMPAEGREQAVLDGLNGFVSNQQASFELYLADQYEIAKAARVETLADGTVLMVMCEDSDQVYSAITAALEG
jgi:hypothetical protein